MKKCILLLMIVSKILFSGGEISFEKQKEESSKIFNEIEHLNKIINEMPGSFSGS